MWQFHWSTVSRPVKKALLLLSLQTCKSAVSKMSYAVLIISFFNESQLRRFQHSKIGLVILQTIQLSLYYKQYSSGYITNNTNLVKIQTSLYYKQYSSRYITNNTDHVVIQWFHQLLWCMPLRGVVEKIQLNEPGLKKKKKKKKIKKTKIRSGFIVASQLRYSIWMSDLTPLFLPLSLTHTHSLSF